MKLHKTIMCYLIGWPILLLCGMLTIIQFIEKKGWREVSFLRVDTTKARSNLKLFLLGKFERIRKWQRKRMLKKVKM
jgi:hypothetical protein